MKLRLPSSTIAVLLLAFAAPGHGQSFVFPLRGDQETPPVASPASGGCLATLTGATLAITCVHDVVGATVMHIHRGAATTAGPIVFDLGDPASPVTATWTGMTSADVMDVQTGGLYINIHTAGRPGGEIRGQIVDVIDVVPFGLDGAQFVPPSSSAATGTCAADLSNADPPTSLAITCTHSVPAPVEAHLHEAPFGQNGPLVFTFASASSPLSEPTIPVTPVQVAEYAATFLYLEVHGDETSEATPATSIRGQVGTPPAGATTGTLHVTKRTFPPGSGGFGFTTNLPGGPGAFTLADGQTQSFSGVAPGSYQVTESDPAAAPGGFALVGITCGDGDSTGDPFARRANIALQAGEDITCTFTNLRNAAGGQIFVFDLSGSQEVPPVPSPARGGCAARLEAGPPASLSLLCVHDVVGATIMHVHRGAPGVNGPIAFDLGAPASPVSAIWSGMTSADVAELLAGNLYVNIHDSGRPAGEIRGQIVPRSVDSFDFPLTRGPGGALGGTCRVDLSDDASILAFTCNHQVASPTAAHLHEGPAGTGGPIAFTFPNPSSPFAAGVPTHPLLLADFAAGFLSVDVHSLDPDSGEERSELSGQVAPGFLALDIPALDDWVMLLLGTMLAALGAWKLGTRR